jgi:hypothetical protein
MSRWSVIEQHCRVVVVVVDRLMNTPPESKRGMQHQSIDPSRPTSAAVWQSPISP